MSETRWTPGPWRTAVNDLGGFSIEAGDSDLTNSVLCQRADWPYRAAESLANARLIAAAPTMADYIARKAAEGDKEAAWIMQQARGE